MKCKICQNESRKIFDAIILNKYRVDYFYCDNCGFLQTEEPYWLTEAYGEPINISDTGYLQRNISLSKKTLFLFLFLFGKKYKYLDYAGGYGVLTRLMRDLGMDFYWNDKYAKNLFARGFSHKFQKIKAITCLECFEHFNEPIREIENILNISKNIFFSTTLLPIDNPPKPEKWWYYGLEHGQHISFYSIKTLKIMAKKFHLNFYTNNTDLHFFTEKNINNKIFKILMFLSKFNIDLFIKKIIKSKVIQDYKFIVSNIK